MNTPVIVALITGAFAIIVALIQSSRKENRDDHALVAQSLNQIHKDIHRVGEKVDQHIQWHAEGGNDVRASRRTQD